MVAVSNSLNAHNLSIFQPILMILVSKSMVHRALSDRIYLVLELLSPLRSLYGKQCGPRSDCSYRSSLFLVHAVCFCT